MPCSNFSAFMCVVVHPFLLVCGIYQEFGFGFRVRKCGPHQQEVYQQEFRTAHLNFWKEEKPSYPPFLPRAPLVVKQILKVGKGKHIPKDMEGGGFPQACGEEETQNLRQTKAWKKWKEAKRVETFRDLGGLGGGGGVKHEAVQHCGGVVWSVQARILPLVAQTPSFSLAYARCARAMPRRPQSTGFGLNSSQKKRTLRKF